MASAAPIKSNRVSRTVKRLLNKRNTETKKTRKQNTSRYTNLQREGAENTQSQNNKTRPRIESNTIIDITNLLRIKEEEYKNENIGRSLTPAEVKILATLLIDRTKFKGAKGVLHSLTKTRKQSNKTRPYTASVRDVLKQISLIEPDVKNRTDYNLYINYIQHILNDSNNYNPDIVYKFLFHKTLILSLNNDDVSVEAMTEAFNSVSLN